MSGVKDGTCRVERAVRATSGLGVLLCGLALWACGCQSAPTFRGQTPGFNDSAETARRPRRIDDSASPHEELLPEELHSGLAPIGEGDSEELTDPIVDIAIEGNDTIESAAIRKLIRSPIGRPPSESQIREDVRALFSTRWFFAVEPRYRRKDAGLVLVFRVIERPMVETVEFRGNERVKTKYLEKLTGLKNGSPFDVSVNREAAKRIEEHYKSKGFPYTKVTLEKGNRREERDVVFVIDEGPKVIVGSIKFEGNESFAGSLLKTKLSLKPAFLGLPFWNKYKPEQLPDDVAALKQYYHCLGYFDVNIEKDVAIDEDPWNPLSYKAAHAIITYRIQEGPRFQIRNLVLEGNQVFTNDELAADLKLRSGDAYNARLMNKDVEAIKERYGHLGRTFASVDPIPRFLEETGEMDLVYQINEDRVYTIRHINVHIQGDHPHTRESVVRNRILTHPGDLADPKKISMSEQRLKNQIFDRVGPTAPRAQIAKVPEKPTPNRSQIAQAGGTVRGQSPDPTENSVLLAQVPPPQYGFGAGASDPLVQDIPPGQLDIEYYATEAQTGRLSFGVGVNSNSGVVGSIVLEEQNFDITRFPRSFEDVRNGTAFRGAGQQFRLEAVPGNIVSRYLASWTDPYFLDSDFSLGISGFFFQRFYRDWREDRLGGRITVGRQLTQEWSVIGSIRLESVDLSNPSKPTPALLTEALGTSFLSTGRVAIAHDTRDSQFLPANGHYVMAGFEQAFGEYSYPRFDAEAHQYFTTYSRPDGGGRHILSLGLQAAWTGDNTPIFERYFAGGFQSLRGFSFRGVSPIDGKVRIGGQWMFLGGAEYLIPVTADETLGVVGFTDFGTVEDSNVSLKNFRLTVGAGLRITIPLMGPAPIAIDWGFPILREDFDDTRIFNFSVGITR
jgi:outer membrane protein insertion porin family